jgi:hypothetical protein
MVPHSPVEGHHRCEEIYGHIFWVGVSQANNRKEAGSFNFYPNLMT